MSYTDNRPAPQPTRTERAFANLTDADREKLSMYWLLLNAPEFLADYELWEEAINDCA